MQYFSLSDTPPYPKDVRGLDEKKIRTKYHYLIKLGLPDWAVLSLANTRKAYWHIAGDSLEMPFIPVCPGNRRNNSLPKNGNLG